MTKDERQARAHLRATPHLEVAFARITDLGITPMEAAQCMLMFGAGRMVDTLTEDQVKATIFKARDRIHEWMTDVGEKAGAMACNGRFDAREEK